MSPEAHVAGDVLKGCIGMSCGVVEEMVNSGTHFGDGGGAHCGGDGADCGLHCTVDGAGVVEEGAEEFLHPFLVFVG